MFCIIDTLYSFKKVTVIFKGNYVEVLWIYKPQPDHAWTYMYPYLPKLFILLLPLFFNQVARFCIVIL